MPNNVHVINHKVPKAQWEAKLDAVYRRKNKEVKIDGFRKGMAPKNVYLQKRGIESLYLDAASDAVSEAYEKVLAQTKLKPVIQPQVDIKSVTPTGIEFIFTIIERPEIELGQYKDLKIKRKPIRVTASEVEAEITRLQSQMAEIVVKEKGNVEEGDTAIIDFKGYVDGKLLAGASGENFPLEIGSNTFIPGFESGLIGAQVNDEVTLNLTFPTNYTPELKGKKVRFKVKIREIKMRQLPKVNREFYRDLGYDKLKTKAELETEIKAKLHQQKEVTVEDQYIEACLAQAAADSKIEINPEIIRAEVDRMLNQFEQKLTTQGLNKDQYYQYSGMDEAKLRAKMEPEAKKRIHYRYLIEKVAELEQIKITDQEAEQEADTLAKTYGMTKAELLKNYGGLEVVKYDLKMHKALEIIKA